jgi:hypothetical protein
MIRGFFLLFSICYLVLALRLSLFFISFYSSIYRDCFVFRVLLSISFVAILANPSGLGRIIITVCYLHPHSNCITF